MMKQPKIVEISLTVVAIETEIPPRFSPSSNEKIFHQVLDRYPLLTALNRPKYSFFPRKIPKFKGSLKNP